MKAKKLTIKKLQSKKVFFPIDLSVRRSMALNTTTEDRINYLFEVVEELRKKVNEVISLIDKQEKCRKK